MERLQQAETTADRAMWPVSHRMNAAKFLVQGHIVERAMSRTDSRAYCWRKKNVKNQLFGTLIYSCGFKRPDRAWANIQSVEQVAGLEYTRQRQPSPFLHSNT
jgi:hypothetical protein